MLGGELGDEKGITMRVKEDAEVYVSKIGRRNLRGKGRNGGGVLKKERD